MEYELVVIGLNHRTTPVGVRERLAFTDQRLDEGNRRLPSLESLDESNSRFVTWGFAFFTFGMMTGSVLAKISWGSFLKAEPVQILSILTWLLYAVQIHARSSGWRGRRAALLTIAGFVLLAASFVGITVGWHKDTVD